MIQVYRKDEAVKWAQERLRSLAAASNSGSALSLKVSEIIASVRERGDLAISALSERFGDKPLAQFSVDSDFAQSACARVTADSKETIDFAAANILRFAEAIMSGITSVNVEYSGYRAGLNFSPVASAACYVPGGRYPLPSTALMTAITAKVAGVKDVYLLTPALSDEILYAGTIAGVSRFYQIGGAQAVAAAAFGTETVTRTDMIVGPGNAYVTEAKRQLLGVIGIDMLAGPSEVTIIADKSANAEWLALDMLSQAEHDPDARCYLLTDSEELADEVRRAIEVAVTQSASKLPPFIKQSLAGSAILVCDDLFQCAWISNSIAPEHLAISVAEPDLIRSMLTNFGALFVGKDATVPYGDYVAGPNHTLPTGGTARFSSGLTPLTFLRTQTWLDVPSPSADLSKHTDKFAVIEGLTGHAAAARARSKLGSAGVPGFDTH